MADIPSYQIARDGQLIGTFTVLEVEKRRRSKVSNDILGDLVPDRWVNKLNETAILPTDQFWREGMSEWRPMTDFRPEFLAYKEAERKRQEAEKLARRKAEQERAAQAAIEAEKARKEEERNRVLAEQKAKEAEEAAARKAIAAAEAVAAEIRMRQEQLAQERARVEREKAEQAKAEAARRREQAIGTQWYFLEGDRRMGPVSGARILELQAETRLSVDTLVCPRAGDQQWIPLYATPLGDAAVPPPPALVEARPAPLQPPYGASPANSRGTAPDDDGLYFLAGYGGVAGLFASAFLPFCRVGPIGISLMVNGGTTAGFLLLALAAYSCFACAQRSSSGLQISGVLGVFFLIYAFIRLLPEKPARGGNELGEAIQSALLPQPDIGFVVLILACVLLFVAGSRATR